MAHTRLLAAAFLLVVCVLAPVQGTSCPEPFFLMGSRCVFVESGSPGLYIDWDSGRKLCAEKVAGTNWTADLISNYDAAFQRLLTKHIKEFPNLEGYKAYFVGVEMVDKEWRWLDGTPIDNMDYIWAIRSPYHDFENPQWMKGVLTLPPDSTRLVVAERPSYVTSPCYVCEAKLEA